MTGERWNWYLVSYHLKIPVRELKRRLTYEEFNDWLVFLESEYVEPAFKQEAYLAQIAAEVRRSYVADARKVKVMDFLINLTPAAPAKPVLPEDRKVQMAKSKTAWAGHLNIDLQKKRRKQKKK